MKKAFLLLLLTIIAAPILNAQVVKSFYGNTPTVLANPYGAGYITGTNGYGDIGKYQRIDIDEAQKIFGMEINFAVVNIVDTPDTISIVLRSVDGSGAPGDIIATKKTTSDVLDSTAAANLFLLDEPVVTSESVFIGFEFAEASDDTIAVYADADGEGEGANRVWEQFSDGKFNDFGTTLEPSYSWGLDTDLWITALSINSEENVVFNGDAAYIHANPYGAGYITGTNGYGDIGKYQKVEFDEEVELKSLNFYFAVNQTVDTPDDVNMVVRSVAADGTPGNVIFSKTVSASDITVDFEGNKIAVDTKLKLSSAFVGFEFAEGADDTIAIYADPAGLGEGANRAWEQFSDGKFNDFGTTLEPSYSWGLDTDLWISVEYAIPLPYESLFYGDSASVLVNPYGAGYITGTNGYGDIGKYQRMDFGNPVTLNGFKYYFAVAQVVNDPDSVSLVVREVSNDGSPGELIYIQKVSASELDTTLAGNLYIMDEGVEVGESVFIGFEFSEGADDTIAVYADQDGKGDGANRVWEQFSDGKFNDFGTTVEPSYSWAIDTDLWIEALYTDSVAVGISQTETIPNKYELSQNYPNPFNPSTNIEFTIPNKGLTTLRVYNVLGQEVAELLNKELNSGSYKVEFNAVGLTSGIYFYKLQSENYSEVRKMMLIK